jgi:hypothetical protein
VAVDFQVVFPTEVVSLSSVRYAAGAEVPTLEVLGTDFRSVDQVLINDVASSNVIVLSKNRLLAEVPEVARTEFVPTRVVVLSRRLTLSERSLIQFRVGRTASKVSGILRLVQLFLKVLFTTPGTDMFAPKTGSAALKNIGANIGRTQRGAVISDFVLAVDGTARQMLTLQSRDSGLPSDEKLLSARVVSSSFDARQEALVVTVEITSQAGRLATANVLV